MKLPRHAIIWHVFRTEILQVTRDRVTVFFSVILPFLMWPLLAALMTQTVIGHFLRLEEAVSSIAFISEHAPPGLATHLQDTEKLLLIELSDVPAWPTPPPPTSANTSETTSPALPQTLDTAHWPEAEQRAWAEQLISDEMVNALLLTAPQAQSEDGTLTNYDAWIIYDSTDNASSKAANRLREALLDWQQAEIQQRLVAKGLDSSYVQPLTIQRENLASLEKQSRSQLGPLLPYILVIMLLISSFHPAIEMTAGEKEHGTLPTLLSTPINYLELVLGKYFAIVVIAVVSVGANMISLGAVLAFGIGQLAMNLSIFLLGLIFFILLPLAFLFAAVAMAVAVFANSYREGQNFLSPLMIVGMLPAISSLLPDIELTYTLALVPSFNAALLIKQLLIEPVATELIILTVLSNSVLAILALIFTTRVFASEPVIFASGGLLNTLLSVRRTAFPYPNASISLFIYLILFILTFYVSLMVGQAGLFIQVPVIQLLIFLSIPLLLTWYFHWPLKQVFRLQRPSGRMVLAAILIGNTAWLAFSWTAKLLPPPPEFTQRMIELLSLTDDQYSLLAHLILIALLPGICEEFAFRGLLLSGFLRSFSPAWAIILTALCFGLAHMSLYRFIPTAVLGIILGYVVWKTGSIWLAVIIHTLNNANGVLVARYFGEEALADPEQMVSIPAVLILGAVVICTLGLWLIYREPRIAANSS